MSTPTLNNSNLIETMLPSASYNALPFINVCKLEPLNHVAAHAELLDLIKARGLSSDFSIHLIHKHFDMPEDLVAVYSKVKGGKTIDFTVMAPRDPKTTTDIRGLYFMATSDGKKMTAYEYTTEPAQDLSAYEDFVAEFAITATRLGVGHIFALGAVGITSLDKTLAEFEMSSHLATVIVEDDALPDLRDMDYTGTDWSPVDEWSVADGSAHCGGAGQLGGKIFPEVPGMLKLKCIFDRVGKHNYHGESVHGPTVESRQSMPGLSHQAGNDEVKVYPGIQVGGMYVEKDSVIHDVMHRAVQAIEAY